VSEYSGNGIGTTISVTVTVTTLAGSGTYGYAEGTGTVAQFTNPEGVAVDSAGNVYVADTQNHRIRKISPAGVATTFAGGTQGYGDGTGTAAQFDIPLGLALDNAENLYVVDTHRIRKISPAGVVTTLAGNEMPGNNNIDGIGIEAKFNYPCGVAVDSTGNVYVADASNYRIRKISPSGVVTTLAGSGTSGFSDGTGTAAQFRTPYGVAVDSMGNVYVADQGNYRIRKISPSGVVTTLAGSGTSGSSDGTGTAAQFRAPYGVAVDSAGNVYVTDYSACIKKISPAGVVTTLAGSSTSGYADGTATAAQFNCPRGVAVDIACNVYVADSNNHCIRKIEQ
jgi:sugar lactone lactonase YvrE